jgi:hypothetical protein
LSCFSFFTGQPIFLFFRVLITKLLIECPRKKEEEVIDRTSFYLGLNVARFLLQLREGAMMSGGGAAASPVGSLAQ